MILEYECHCFNFEYSEREEIEMQSNVLTYLKHNRIENNGKRRKKVVGFHVSYVSACTVLSHAQAVDDFKTKMISLI